MYKCRHCGEVFNEEDVNVSVTFHPWRYREAEESFEECPNCGSGDFEEAEQCEECGEWFLPDELYGDRCEFCLDKALTIDTAFDYAEDNDDEATLIESILSATEIKNILISAAKAKVKLGRMDGMREYVLDDKGAFGEYLQRRMGD